MSGGYISKITFNNNQSVEINANDMISDICNIKEIVLCVRWCVEWERRIK